MTFKRTYFIFLLVGLLAMSLVGTAQAVSTVFMSGDQGSYNTGGASCSGANPECVSVNTTTSYQKLPADYPRPPGESALANATGSGVDRDVLVLNGSGGAGTLTFPNTFWYQPSANNPIITGGTSLNGFLTSAAGSSQTAAWTSYTSSGTTGTGANFHPNPPAVPNYCGTSTGTGGSPSAPVIGGNINPSGNPGCNTTDFKGNQQKSAPDLTRTSGNATAKFTQTVNLGPGTYDLEFYVWTDDTTIVDVRNGGSLIALNTANPFPANTANPATNITVCLGDSNPVSCPPAAGQKFTASGLSGGTYTFTFSGFQIGSDVFGMLYGGAFTQTSQVPEPGTVVLLGIGLAGLGLIRRRKQA